MHHRDRSAGVPGPFETYPTLTSLIHARRNQEAKQEVGRLEEDLGLPFLDQTKLLEHFDAVVTGHRAYTWQVWRWVNFARWYGSLR